MISESLVYGTQQTIRVSATLPATNTPHSETFVGYRVQNSMFAQCVVHMLKFISDTKIIEASRN